MTTDVSAEPIRPYRMNVYRDLAGQRRRRLAGWSPACGYTMDWIDHNRARFQKEVYFPPAVSVTVSDDRYASVVEATINRNAMQVSTP